MNNMTVIDLDELDKMISDYQDHCVYLFNTGVINGDELGERFERIKYRRIQIDTYLAELTKECNDVS